MTTVNDSYVAADWTTFQAAMAQSPSSAAAAKQMLSTLQGAVAADTVGMDAGKRATVSTDINNLMGLLGGPNFSSNPQWQADIQKLAVDLGQPAPAATNPGTPGPGVPTTPAPGAPVTPAPGTPAPGTPVTPAPSSSSSSSSVTPPVGLTGPQQAQWQAMQTQETAALQNEAGTRSTIAANYAQAGIKAPVDSALPPSDPSTILNDPLAAAAEKQMAANYPQTGSMDLTQDQINQIYGPAIQAASAKTGVPASVLSTMIYTESKGHPLTSNGGLMQIDPVAWGQMKDQDPSLTNRYNPADNIMAGAMYLASKDGGNPPTSDAGWMALYHGQYQG